MKHLSPAIILVLQVALAASAQTPHSRPTTTFDKTPSEMLERLSNGREGGEDCRWDIADHLGKPKNKALLLSAFEKTTDEDKRLGIIYALYRISDAEISQFFNGLIRNKYDDGEELYYPLNYLAK